MRSAEAGEEMGESMIKDNLSDVLLFLGRWLKCLLEMASSEEKGSH